MPGRPATVLTLTQRLLQALVPTACALTLISACNGSSDGITSGSAAAESTEPAFFSGTVSTPRGITEQVISLKSPDGSISQTAVDELGRFTIETTTADRYLLRADLGNDNYLYSVAHLTDPVANRKNIHSYTDLVARTWFADLGLDIDSVFASSAGIENFPDEQTISLIDTNVQAIVSDVMQAYGLADASLATDDFAANDTGVDRFLNENPVIIRDNRATIIVNDPMTNLQATAVDRVRLITSFGETDITPPSQPQDLRALGSRSMIEVMSAGTVVDEAIVLAWSTATDNIGVASYEIFRDDVLIDHTPFPIYRDTNVVPATNYTYAIVSIDETGNRSAPSLPVTGSTLLQDDTTPPQIPSSATLNASTESIEVFWTQSDLNDLVRFEVTRTGGDVILVREVTSPRLNDITVASGTEYCYTIVAVDASGNRSEPNPRACITTSGVVVTAPDMTVTPATVELAQSSISGAEGTVISAFINRLDDSSGEISIDYVITPGTAIAEEDYVATDGTLVWADGDIVAKQIDISLLPDDLVEDTETLTIVLTSGSPDVVVTNAITTVNITDINQP